VPRLWTKEEIEILRDTSIPIADVARIVGRSYDACSAKANELGIQRIRHFQKVNIIPVGQQILALKNLLEKELEEESDHPYFQGRKELSKELLDIIMGRRAILDVR